VNISTSILSRSRHRYSTQVDTFFRLFLTTQPVVPIIYEEVLTALGIRHWFYGGVGENARQEILNALAAAGVASEDGEQACAEDARVIFFSEITPDLCRLLRDAGSHGLQRVLAVSLARDKLANGASWTLLKSGASDVLCWEESKRSADEIAARFDRWQQVDSIIGSPMVQKNLAGRSPVWIRVLRHVVEVARFTDASVLITGESGTGKELIARLIHTLDQREKKRELVITDCTTVVPELAGSEFFGHERGAFTGAVAARDGSFAAADGGSLFLDEVGELPLTLQAELLRVVQEGTYKRVGSNSWQRAEFRLICATNRDLVEEQRRGHFRSDFYYRIASWTCHLPPLRERREDILPLAQYFIEQLRPDDPPGLDEAVREYLLSRDYRGNVRELKQLITRMVRHHVGPGPITVGNVPEDQRPESNLGFADWRTEGFDHAVHRALSLGVGLKVIGRAAEDAAERIALAQEDGNLQRAAAKLGLTDRALQMRRAARRQNGHRI
jgi:transcriptional regulator with GAF, ATPase, and Fis domain